VGKEFDLHGMAGGARYVSFPNGVSNGSDLLERQLAGEHDDVGITGIEADGSHI